MLSFSGTAEYGNSEDDSAPWSIKWELDEFDDFLFSSGNFDYWMIAKKEDIVGVDGLKNYTNEEIQIQSSYLSCEISSGGYDIIMTSSPS